MNDPQDLDPRGIKWMGDTPDGWGKEPVKRHYEIQLGKMLQNNPSTDNDILVPYLKALHVLWGRVEKDNLPEMWASPKENQQYGLQDGDLLVCEGGEVGRAGIVKSPPEKCIIQNALHRIRPKRSSDVCFLQWVLHAVNSSGWFDVLCNRATIAHFTREKVANLRIPVPKKDVQHTIAYFLDRQTNRIDILISKKERQIELLQEKRVALISDAVSKGLDPSVKMKDSGIGWLGEIPAHWELRKLKYISTARFSNVDKHKVEGEVPVRLCNYVDVYYNEYITPDLNFMEATASLSEIAKFKLIEGDVIVTKDSESWDDIAVPAYVQSRLPNVLCGYHLAQIRPNPKLINGEYLFRSFSGSGINDQFKVAATGITRYGLGKYWLENSLFPVPPMDEQSAIVSFLGQETEKIDQMTQKINDSVRLLQEYRTALIAAAVTGKIDVRNAV